MDGFKVDDKVTYRYEKLGDPIKAVVKVVIASNRFYRIAPTDREDLDEIFAMHYELQAGHGE